MNRKLSWVVIVLLVIFVALFYFVSSYLKTRALATLKIECAATARTFFNDDNSKNDTSYSVWYENHFNSKLNKCFILVYFSSLTDTFTGIDLYDAAERKHYATYNGHRACPPGGDECQSNGGSIWLSGNDSSTPDVQVGFGYMNKQEGSSDTEKEFISKIQAFMTE